VHRHVRSRNGLSVGLDRRGWPRRVRCEPTVVHPDVSGRWWRLGGVGVRRRHRRLGSRGVRRRVSRRQLRCGTRTGGWGRRGKLAVRRASEVPWVLCLVPRVPKEPERTRSAAVVGLVVRDVPYRPRRVEVTWSVTRRRRRVLGNGLPGRGGCARIGDQQRRVIRVYRVCHGRSRQAQRAEADGHAGHCQLGGHRGRREGAGALSSGHECRG
jgi:hypothetical protein